MVAAVLYAVLIPAVVFLAIKLLKSWIGITDKIKSVLGRHDLSWFGLNPLPSERTFLEQEQRKASDQVWWWEVVGMFRKATVVMVTMLEDPAWSLYISLWCISTTWVLQMFVNPYERTRFNVLEHMYLIAIICCLNISLLFNGGQGTEATQGDGAGADASVCDNSRSGFTTLMMVIIFLVAAVLIGSLIHEFFYHVRRLLRWLRKKTTAKLRDVRGDDGLPDPTSESLEKTVLPSLPLTIGERERMAKIAAHSAAGRTIAHSTAGSVTPPRSPRSPAKVGPIDRIPAMGSFNKGPHNKFTDAPFSTGQTSPQSLLNGRISPLSSDPVV
eukprot:gene12098-333_t